MPAYHYDSINVPDEARHVLNGGAKVARINYVKRLGDRGAKWIVGLGRFSGKRFILEEEFMVDNLVIHAPSYGLFATQKASDGTEYDRGWILVVYSECVVGDGVCILR